MKHSTKTLSNKLEKINSSYSFTDQSQPICMTIVGNNGEIILDKFTHITPDFYKALQELKEEEAPNASKSKGRHKNKLGYIDSTVAGIDIGDKVIHVAFPNRSGGVFVEEFETTTPALHRIGKKLKEKGVTTAVMEATGVYWVPLYDILEEKDFKAVLVDAKSVKNVPGRKSDVVDAQWIQTLYSNGLLRAAFRPPRNRLKLR
nr:transposase [Nitrosopumilus sp.]HEV8051178.1 transposase [Parachlamydiaceae bacterium]